MSDLHTTEGIVLQVIPYGNEEQILTLFTPLAGIIKVFCKRSVHKGQRFMPLTLTETIYRERKSEICACEEIILLNAFLSLRQTYSLLQGGCDLLRVIYGTQMVGKPAPQLYSLLLYCLETLPKVKDVQSIVICFKLKVLMHEGLLDIMTETFSGFRQEEQELLRFLTVNRALVPLREVVLDNDLGEKVDQFFNYRIHQI